MCVAFVETRGAIQSAEVGSGFQAIPFEARMHCPNHRAFSVTFQNASFASFHAFKNVRIYITQHLLTPSPYVVKTRHVRSVGIHNPERLFAE